MQKFDKKLTKNAILNPKPYEISNLTFCSKTTKSSKHENLQNAKKLSKIQKKSSKNQQIRQKIDKNQQNSFSRQAIFLYCNSY